MALVEFAALAAMCAPNVHLTTLESIVTHESRANIYAIGVNGDYVLPRQPASLEEAVATAEWLSENGYDFDSGLGQINARNVPKLGLTFEQVFDPCTNLKAAAQILTECYERAVPRYGAGQPGLQAALSCYNTGNFERGFANGYVYKVAAHVGTTVPALEAISSGEKAAPVVLQGSGNGRAQAAPAAPKPAPKREGIPDAFGAAPKGAFSVADNRQEEQTD